VKPIASLPRLDEHTTTIDADPERAWRALVDTVDGLFARRVASVYARIVGCEPSTASGPRPFAEGGTVPGFRVAVAAPPHRLVLEGRHRFSSYRLTFRLEAQGPERTVLHAESHAAFPGIAGRGYRLVVVRSGVHVVAVRRVLATIRRRAEQG
jgi:hypothetical protein